MEPSFTSRTSRGMFLRNAALAGAAIAAAGAGADLFTRHPLTGEAATDSVESIISTALIAEQLATAFYYTGLTSPAVMRNAQLAGISADPTNPGLPPGGNPGNVRYLQAGLDSEVKHAATLAHAGAKSPITAVYFPASTFTRMGSSTDAGSFLGVLDALETAFVGAYLAAIGEFITLGHPDLAELAGEIMGVEAEHRALGRVIAGVDPANNLTLEKTPFTAVSQAGTALAPFLTGKGFAGGATKAIALPTSAQTTRVIGKYGTHTVSTFL